MIKFMILFLLLVMPLVTGVSYQIGSDVVISHPIRINGGISPSIIANISIQNPNSAFIIPSNSMTFNTTTQEHQFNLDGGNLTEVGIYPYCITAEGSGLNSTVCYEDLEVTQSGFSRINSGEGIIISSGLFVMLALAIFSFILFIRSETFIGKITFLSLTGILLLITIFFSTILIQQNLGGFDNVLSGYESFVFVVKSITTVAIIAFLIFVFLFMIKAWRIRNGITN